MNVKTGTPGVNREVSDLRIRNRHESETGPRELCDPRAKIVHVLLSRFHAS
jgi:hypothetical protein